MSSLSFPDLNVWLALVVEPHVHRAAALAWWDSNRNAVAFCRFTQMGLLRLLTTPAATNDRPLAMGEAWRVYDRLFEDDRVCLIGEPPGVEPAFRKQASGRHSSPKLWADAYLVAFAERAEATLVTFDKGLASRAPGSVLLS
jgi:toxin-antitoxin system PIN domain toxin